MFYSHEILSNTQHGVSTIWLVATVGKGTQKRLNRKSIQEVNVPKACEKILDPGAPLALRLQGSLLYGVSRVFSQQCGYVLSDAEKTQSDMMAFFRAMKASEVDPKAGKTKRHNIVLQDDPEFDPMNVLLGVDLFADTDMAIFPSQGSAGKFSQMTPLGTASQGSCSSGRQRSLINFDLSQSSRSAGSYRIPSDLGHPISPFAKQILDPENMPEFRPFGEDEFDPIGGIGLDIDENGNLVGIIDPEPELPPFPSSDAQVVHTSQRSNVQFGEDQGQGIFDTGDDMVLNMGENALPDADAFPPRPSAKEKPTSSHNPTSESTETEKAAAPSRRTLRRKLHSMLDQSDRIPRDVFRGWSENYAQNMEASSKRQKTTTHAQAKKNALAFLFDNGLAGVGHSMAIPGMQHPLAASFAGIPLKAHLQGREPDASDLRVEKRGCRRKSPEAFGEEGEQDRNVRQRVNDDVELGRGDLGDHLVVGDESAPEIGLEAVPGLEDHHSSSMMPWSRPGSAIPGSSIRGQGSAQKGGLPMPSPLHAKGSAVASIERFSDPAGPAFGSDGFSQDMSSNFEGPIGSIDFARGGDTQGSGSLDIASQAFLAFATEKAAKEGVTSSTNDNRRWIEFTDIAIEKHHSKAVAAAGFMHILSLASKNIIAVEQDGVRKKRPYGAIHIGLDFVPEGEDSTLADVDEDADELA